MCLQFYLPILPPPHPPPSCVVLGLAFVPLGYDGVGISAIRFQLDMYTGPGFLGALLGIVNVILLALFFRDAKLVSRKDRKKAEKLNIKYNATASNSAEEEPPASNQKCFDVLAAAASIVIFFVILSGFSVFET